MKILSQKFHFKGKSLNLKTFNPQKFLGYTVFTIAMHTQHWLLVDLLVHGILEHVTLLNLCDSTLFKCNITTVHSLSLERQTSLPKIDQVTMVFILIFTLNCSFNLLSNKTNKFSINNFIKSEVSY